MDYYDRGSREYRETPQFIRLSDRRHGMPHTGPPRPSPFRRPSRDRIRPRPEERPRRRYEERHYEIIPPRRQDTQQSHGTATYQETVSFEPPPPTRRSRMHNVQPETRTETFSRVEPVVETRIAPAEAVGYQSENVVVEEPEEEHAIETEESPPRRRRRRSSLDSLEGPLKYRRDDDGFVWEPLTDYGRRDEATHAQAQPYVEYEYERAPSMMGDDMDVYNNFRFAFMSGTGTDLARDDEQSDLESSGADVSSATIGNGSSVSQKASPASRISSSYYTGSAELGGLHTATLTMLHDPKGQTQPLFRWLHVQQTIMNLDEFWSEISHQPRFSDAEKTAIGKLRADIQRNCVKTRQSPKGAKVGYMDPRYLEVPLQTPKKKSRTTGTDMKWNNSTTSKSVKWICMPYFVLQQYSGLDAASTTSLFPSQTLLQAQYSRSTQQRDMDQAVCQLGTAKKGECFHIAQLWCLVVGNSFLVTCGTMPQTELAGNTLKLNSEPSRGPTLSTSNGRILVTYGDAVNWDFTTDECPTWVAFRSKFLAFWPAGLEVKCKRKTLTASDWPRILKLATGPKGSVTLSVQPVVRPDPPPRAVLQPLSSTAPSSEGTATEGTINDGGDQFLHVLTVLETSLQSSTISTTQDKPFEGLTEQLAQADRFMQNQTPYSVQKAYGNCKDSTREGVHRYLELEGNQDDVEQTEEARQCYEDRIDIFNAADILFRFFFPADFVGPTVRKFWGAILAMTIKLGEGSDPPYNVKPSDVTDIRNCLRSISQDVLAFEEIFSTANVQEQARLDVPQQLVTAWLHVLSGLLCAVARTEGWRIHLAKAGILINQSLSDIVQDMPSGQLLEKASMLPMEVLSLLTMELLKDKVGKSDDIGDTYSQYLSSIDTDITTKPSDRSYQHRIELVKQEMTAVKRTLAKQRFIVALITESLAGGNPDDLVRRGMDDMDWRRTRNHGYVGYDSRKPPDFGDGPYDNQQTYPVPAARIVGSEYGGMGGGPLDDQFANELASAAKLSPTDPGGFRSLFLLDCSRLAEQREFEFRRYTEYADELERSVTFKMDSTKDKQENAIYAFTLVTIVFLPLSSVASIFGINTSDVRNMPQSQWVYWAVALPVTVLVILVGLWWMDELDSVMGLMGGGNKFKKQSGSSGGQSRQQQQQQQQRQENGYVARPPGKVTEVVETYDTRPMSAMGESGVQVRSRMDRGRREYHDEPRRTRERQRSVYRY